jgi:hypothetical protein
MNTIITSQTTATSDHISQARHEILSAQRLVLASEGRTLDFETADEINRKLLASIENLSIIIEPFDEDDTLTDDEMLELEMRLSRDHDDPQFSTMGGAR